jgi:hypothetical protein
MNTIIKDNFGSITTSDDETRVMVLPPYDPTNPTKKFTSEDQALAIVEKYKGNSKYWSTVSVEQASKPLNPVAFMGLFTIAERVALRAYALSDNATAPYIAELLRTLDHPALISVDVFSPDVQAGLDLFVSSGILTTARRAIVEAA